MSSTAEKPVKKPATAKSLAEEIKAKRKELRRVNASILERKAYLAEQERAVDDAVDTFNNRLRELSAEINTIELQKENHLNELADLKEQKDALEFETAKLEKRLEDLKTVYEASVAKFKVELRELQVDIQSAKANRARAIDSAQEIVKRLTLKEQELDNRENILLSREQQLI